jgi:hypothetical protein
MSGTVINSTDLQRYARDPDLEIRVSTGHQGKQAVDTATGSWGGRLIRNLKLIFSAPTTEERRANIDAKEAVALSLKATFGDDIGSKAFRAHIGRAASGGGWESSSANPITGRHIAAMIETAQKELAGRHDDSKMQQISIGGMAGPFSKGVCKGATMEWFRRIDSGRPTWRHEPDQAGTMRQLNRNSIDWEQKRERLQAIQDHGQLAEPQFLQTGKFYRPNQLHGNLAIPSGRVGLDIGEEFAQQLFQSAAQRNGDPNQFWQLNATLAGRVWGSVDHAIGIKVERVPNSNTNTPADYMVSVFDANEREAVNIPGNRFGAWLSAHMTDSYGDRVKGMILNDVVKIDPHMPSPDTNEADVPVQHPTIPALRYDGTSLTGKRHYVLEAQAGAPQEESVRKLAVGGFDSDDCRFVARSKAVGVLALTPGDDLPPMPNQFWKDISRQEMVVYHGVNPPAAIGIKLTRDNDPETHLEAVAGSRTGATNLALFLTQDLFSTLNAVGTPLISKGAQGGVQTAPRDGSVPRQRVEAARTVDEQGRACVEVTLARDLDLKALAQGMDIIDLDPGRSHLSQTMKLRILEADLGAGMPQNFQILEMPKVSLRAAIDRA